MPKSGFALDVRSSVCVAEVTKFETSGGCRRDRMGGRVHSAPTLHPSDGNFTCENERPPPSDAIRKKTQQTPSSGPARLVSFNVIQPISASHETEGGALSIFHLRASDWRSATQWSNQRASFPELRCKGTGCNVVWYTLTGRKGCTVAH